MVVVDLLPNKLVDGAVFVKPPPKIVAAEFGDETFAANAPNEVDPKRPLPAEKKNGNRIKVINRFVFPPKMAYHLDCLRHLVCIC